MNRISCVLCHHKGTLIDQAVDSIMKSKRVEFEIIIVTSDEACMERFKNVENVICVFAKGGPAGKRNLALKYAQYPLIAFFDDDIEVCANTLWEMAEVLKKDNVVGRRLIETEYNLDVYSRCYLMFSIFSQAKSNVETV